MDNLTKLINGELYARLEENPTDAALLLEMEMRGFDDLDVFGENTGAHNHGIFETYAEYMRKRDQEPKWDDYKEKGFLEGMMMYDNAMELWAMRQNVKTGAAMQAIADRL